MTPLDTPVSPVNKAAVIPLTAVIAWLLRGITTGDWTDDGTVAGALATAIVTAVVWLTPNRARHRR